MNVPLPLVQESGVRPFHLSPGHVSHSALVPKMFLRRCFVLAGPESLDRPLESLNLSKEHVFAAYVDVEKQTLHLAGRPPSCPRG